MSDPTRSVPENANRVLLDVNALAISLVDDHPGYEYVRPEVDAGLVGGFEPLVFDAHPLRVQYLLTSAFGIDRIPARNGVQSLLRQPVRIIGASKETLLAAYEISSEKRHDVYDCFLLALARDYEVDALLTTDTDFGQLCADESFTYVNPVPSSVLEAFDGSSG